MKPLYRLVPILLVSLCASAVAVNVVTDYDHRVTFSQYKSYSWAKVEMPNSLWDERIKEAVDKVLSGKGWTQVPAGGDVSMTALGITRSKPTLQTFYDTFGGWYWNGFGTVTTAVTRYRIGTIVVDMFDTRTKKLIWRGSASDLLSDKPESNIKKLNKAVQRMFDHFPPKSQE
jgi:hypothetical protein